MNCNLRLMCVVAWTIGGALLATATVASRPVTARTALRARSARAQYYKINGDALAVIGEAHTFDSFTPPVRKSRVGRTADGTGQNPGAVASWFVKGTR